MKKKWIVLGIVVLAVLVFASSCVGRYNALVELN